MTATFLGSELRAVGLEGGDLAVEVLTGSTEPVLAVHGLSSTRKIWSWLHAQLIREAL